MTTQTTDARARANLVKLCKRVTENQEIILTSRWGGKEVAFIAADSNTNCLLKNPHELRITGYGIGLVILKSGRPQSAIGIIPSAD